MYAEVDKEIRAVQAFLYMVLVFHFCAYCAQFTYNTYPLGH